MTRGSREDFALNREAWVKATEEWKKLRAKMEKKYPAKVKAPTDMAG